MTQNWEAALFPNLGSSPAAMEAGKAADCYGLCKGHAIEQADAEQAYDQAGLGGNETWVHLPETAWPDAWRNRDGSGKYQRPVVL